MATTPIVLLVHGMGTHPLDNMTREFKTALTEAAKGFAIADFDADEHLEIVEFNYSERLDQIRQALADNAQGILDQFEVLPGGGALVGIVQKLLRYEADLDEDERIYTHWLDVLLYGGTYYGEPLRIELATQINALKTQAAGRDVHVVAHSLGTALLHDTLDKLYRSAGTLADGYPELKPEIDNLKTIWTVANVSRLVTLLNGIIPGNSVVRTGSNGCTDYFFNIRHALDPFTWFKTYNPPAMQSSRTFLNHVVRDRDTHSFQEYVADPDVARYMLLHLTSLQQPKNNANFERCKAEHRRTSINGLYERIESGTRDIRGGDVNSIYELFQAIKAFVDRVRELPP